MFIKQAVVPVQGVCDSFSHVLVRSWRCTIDHVNRFREFIAIPVRRLARQKTAQDCINIPMSTYLYLEFVKSESLQTVDAVFVSCSVHTRMQD